MQGSAANHHPSLVPAYDPDKAVLLLLLLPSCCCRPAVVLLLLSPTVTLTLQEAMGELAGALLAAAAVAGVCSQPGVFCFKKGAAACGAVFWCCLTLARRVCLPAVLLFLCCPSLCFFFLLLQHPMNFRNQVCSYGSRGSCTAPALRSSWQRASTSPLLPRPATYSRGRGSLPVRAKPWTVSVQNIGLCCLLRPRRNPLSPCGMHREGSKKSGQLNQLRRVPPSGESTPPPR